MFVGRFTYSLRLGLLLALCVLPEQTPARAQSPSFLPASPQSSSRPGTTLGGQPGQFEPCTPAEYGDPTADCIPSRAQYGYGQAGYGADTSMLGADFPSGNLGAPRASMNGYPMERSDPGSQPSPTTPAVYQKEPPTEFQRYVAGSTGQLLSIYGSSLFEHVPATFAPLDRIPVGADYRIAPGDEIQVTIWGQLNFSRRQIVDRSGQISLPEAGPLALAGMTYSQAAVVIKASLGHLYKNFDVSVTFARLHPIQVFVLGEARRPGSYSVSAFSTLVNAIFASGGPSARGSMRSIQLRRDNRTICEFDLYDLLLRGNKSEDASLAPGDVIFIPAAGSRIAITGSVGHPAIYEIKAGTTVEQALQFSDGPSALASRNQIFLERVTGNSALQEVQLSLRGNDLQTQVQDGDILRLRPLVQRFHDTVTLRGNVADPGRYPWKPGMHLSDLIPDQEFLLTRDYWKSQNVLGTPESLNSEAESGLSDNSTPQSDSGKGNLVSSDAPVQLASAAHDSLPSATFQDQERHVKGDSSLGAATQTDSALSHRTFQPRYTIRPAVPEINWEYAAIERTDRVSLASHTIAFNLGKVVLSHDRAQDLELQPGDVVTIFSKADFLIPRIQQVTQVRIEGEVGMAGLFTVQPGETLRQVLIRAGGLTIDAYLYGAQFTRESTRREQQKRYNDYLDQLDRDIHESASTLSSRITSAQQAATAQTSIASQRDMVDRLRKVEMDGRIVLNISPQDRDANTLPDLPLQDGDRLYIPSRPSTVNVVGTVYEQSSFLFAEDYRTGDYLKKAGGPSRSADRKHMFIIRADGSVISRKTNPVLFANSFEGLPMFPGDTLVVPTELDRSTLVRNLLDWSQILSSFGLAAAAINVLR